MDEKSTAFISYAWGGKIEKKEWLRDDIVHSLSYEFSVFWDRDAIPFGEAPDDVISHVLAERPIVVLCLCDLAYLASASRVDSGLSNELAMLTQIAGSEGVRIIPIILDRECIGKLPSPLTKKTYLDLSALHARELPLGHAALAVATGGTQAQVAELLSSQLNRADIRDRAQVYFNSTPMKLYGRGSTHEVRTVQGQYLLPQQWMCESRNWKYMLADENETYHPPKGIWHWDYWSPSRGMCALGTAACSAFFPNKTGVDDILAIERAGLILAEHFICFIKKEESFILDSDDLVRVLINHGGINALDRLLPSLDEPELVASAAKSS
jgi:hypothetical protein